MAKGKADIANFAVRAFFQEVGEAYDEMRGLPPYRRTPHLKEVLEFFGSECCFCGDPLTVKTASEDHLIPINKSEMGLHAWGNIVPARADCNKSGYSEPSRPPIPLEGGHPFRAKAASHSALKPATFSASVGIGGRLPLE